MSLFKGAGESLSQTSLVKIVQAWDKFYVDAEELQDKTLMRISEEESAVKGAIHKKDVKYMLTHLNSMLKKAAKDSTLNKEILKKVISAAQEIITSIVKDKPLLRSFTQYSIHDVFSVDHSIRVMDLMLRYLVSSGQDEDKTRSFGTAALLFDIGRLSVPKNILIKIETGQGKLSKKQFEKYREHPQAGFELLKQMGVEDQIVLKGALEHHRAMDHSSFIDKEIPTQGKIIL